MVKQCRTCNSRDISTYFNTLDAVSKEYDGKTYAQLLAELTSLHDSTILPRWICRSCTQRLIGAYDFVLQAQEANEHFINHMKLETASEDEKCLDEQPVILCSVTGRGKPLLAGKQIQQTTTIDPLVYQEEEHLSDSTNYEHKLEPDDEPQMRRAGGKYNCKLCTMSFKYLHSLRRHEQGTHNGRPKRRNKRKENRRLIDFDLNCCKSNGCKTIECMICLQRFGKVSQLRAHLEAHPTDISFEAHGQPIARIAESFYRKAEETTADDLKQHIFDDLGAGIYSPYYSITNDVGYEMSLDSSDTDGDNDEKSYACELCESGTWPRKFMVNEHHLLNHSWLEATNVCKRCNARFVNADLLLHHTKTLCRNTQKRFLCDECPQRFFWRHNYRMHLQSHKENNDLAIECKDEVYQCDKCDRSFVAKNSFTKHMRDHDNESIVCNICKRSFNRLALFHKHLLRHGIAVHDLPLAETYQKAGAKSFGPKKIICKLCDLEFERVKELRSHILSELEVHEEAKNSYMIATEVGFELQLDDTDSDDSDFSTEHKLNIYNCDLCQLQFRRKYEINDHQMSIHAFDEMPYSCGKCIFTTVSKSILEHHVETQCHNEGKKLDCPHCHFKFQYQENLTKHIRTLHVRKPSMLVTESSSPRPFQCPQCDRTFAVHGCMTRHIRNVHHSEQVAIKKSKYLCSLCGLDALSPSKLTIHMRRHTGDKPFKCDLCDKAYPVYFELKVHRRQHTGEQPFQCSVCGKAFARQDKWKQHVLTHGIKN
ncbi:zinc finger protein 26-like [Scaptodrosophila lebanonensis]|uniref:Zinc finger protein 26-like n=1 Tax=Drosophila lebanonensis TaxID=7225 RepID=A0A6J2TJ68_DROLE|nr:zinc finger protein 26-like [Scaptodrosophila lebanonensis]